LAGVPGCRTKSVEGVPVKANELLLWLSARKEGTWNQFRAAVESLHLPDDAPGDGDAGVEDDVEEGNSQSGLPIYQELRLNLQRLAHAEFFARDCDDGWRIAPPVLACCEDEALGWVGILCGARSRGLDARLLAARLEEHREELDGAPCLRRFAGEREALTQLTDQAGLRLQIDVPLAILGSVPAASRRPLTHPVNLPVGRDWKVERFSAEDLKWNESSRDEAVDSNEGLFRFRVRQQWQLFFCLRKKAYEMRQGQLGKFHLLRCRRRRVFRYDEPNRLLSMPASCRPPMLVERALVLCTGKLPSFDPQHATLIYAGVPPLTARLAARLLGQEASL
jgi:hypothetical protein